jgi:hypothetical protein
MSDPQSLERVKELQRLNLMAILAKGQHWSLANPHDNAPSSEWGGKRPPGVVTIKDIQLSSQAVFAEEWGGPIDPEHFVRGTFAMDQDNHKAEHVFAYRRLPALAVHQPWAWAIMEEGDDRKDLDNRNWRPPAQLIGKWIWIHASKQVSRAGVQEVRARGLNMPDPKDLPAGAILGAVQLLKVVDDYPSRWFTGPVGWVFGHPKLLPDPIPVRGQQRLWVPNLHMENSDD